MTTVAQALPADARVQVQRILDGAAQRIAAALIDPGNSNAAMDSRDVAKASPVRGDRVEE